MLTLLTTLHSKYIHASLALPCLAAYCGDACGEIMIREYSVNEPKEIVLAQIVACEAEVICFSVYLWNRVETLELVACLKRINPQLKIVLGGPEVSFETREFFQHHPVDALICGEGEIPLRRLLSTWQQGQTLPPVAGIQTPEHPEHKDLDLLESLDAIPSPFAAGLVDLTRGLVYYESSRGCPYTCSFCMSSLDDRVRSFSLERIKADLQILMDGRVAKIKFVDRTFNYNKQRTLEIFSFILKHNICSHFHFEIGAHLLDEAALKLLEQVPEETFQFEIGVQSTLPETLQRVGRDASLQSLADNVHFLRSKTNIHLHLDLIAGLPGESYLQFLHSIDWVIGLNAHHLQIEPVKLLPGAPLRLQAQNWGIEYDPSPPYTILKSEQLGFDDLERLRGIGRLLDLFVNSGRFAFVLQKLITHFSRLSLLLEDLDRFWRQSGLYAQSLSLTGQCLAFDRYLQQSFSGAELLAYRELLGRDYAHHQRVVAGSAPEFFNTDLSAEESKAARVRVKQEWEALNRKGKVQYFTAVFYSLPDYPGRTVLIFLYPVKNATGLQVKELQL
ncbi:anaerobic magnesium-protoporphyrin IX monomethyl ester cyclase [Desulfuromusa kysingii]|uniref:Anaerobic magnesium-protoporphyrin IX monomethyl ester cyclase n=1 Tax=Desulfuromusa kysingii TaxID=37625 RepID=A0A1H3YM77_9BACT|nr:B12-binding domain-containing radical SAM protein [Desulfuromusa kysingii]SEA12517.1 anaerobic magnesium-protoporphyrin IX monomethyl ester cyclase [Desulfuromusa kysingii]